MARRRRWPTALPDGALRRGAGQAHERGHPARAGAGDRGLPRRLTAPRARAHRSLRIRYRERNFPCMHAYRASLVALAACRSRCAAAAPFAQTAPDRRRGRCVRRRRREGSSPTCRLRVEPASNWINATYITDDTDALAARSQCASDRAGGEATRSRPRKYRRACRGCRADTKRKLDLLRGGITLPAPTRAGRRGRAGDDRDRAVVCLRQGQGHARRQADQRHRHRGRDGRPRAIPAKLQEMWISWHDNVGAPMRDDYAKMVEHRQRGRQGTRLCRYRRDVALGLRHDARRSSPR